MDTRPALPTIGGANLTDGAGIVDVEPKDLITWGIGATAALIAGVGVLLQVRRDRGERRRRQDETDRVWRIDALPDEDEGEWRGLRLVFTDPEAQPCTLHDLTVLKPRGAEIAILEVDHSMMGTKLGEARPLARGRTIPTKIGLTGYRPGRGPADTADLVFHIRLPPPSRWRTQTSVAAVIRLTVSDKSRTRRRRTICITSEEMIVDSTKKPSVM